MAEQPAEQAINQRAGAEDTGAVAEKMLTETDNSASRSPWAKTVNDANANSGQSGPTEKSNNKGADQNVRDNTGQIQRAIENGEKSGIGDKPANRWKPDGVKELPTGDTLVRVNGEEHLFMPNGDRLTVGPKGFDIKAKGPVEISSKGGVTTVTYPNGDQVSFDKQGILSVQRGKEAVSFPRFENLQKNEVPGGNHPVPPMEIPHKTPRKDGPPNTTDKGGSTTQIEKDGTIKKVLPHVEILRDK